MQGGLAANYADYTVIDTDKVDFTFFHFYYYQKTCIFTAVNRDYSSKRSFFGYEGTKKIQNTKKKC